MEFFKADGVRYVPARFVLERYSTNQMTLWRWIRSEHLGFPKPIYIGRQRFWNLGELEAWEARQRERSMCGAVA